MTAPRYYRASLRDRLLALLVPVLVAVLLFGGGAAFGYQRAAAAIGYRARTALAESAQRADSLLVVANTQRARVDAIAESNVALARRFARDTTEQLARIRQLSARLDRAIADAGRGDTAVHGAVPLPEVSEALHRCLAIVSSCSTALAGKTREADSLRSQVSTLDSLHQTNSTRLQATETRAAAAIPTRAFATLRRDAKLTTGGALLGAALCALFCPFR